METWPHQRHPETTTRKRREERVHSYELGTVQPRSFQPSPVQDLSNTLSFDVALRRLVSLNRQLGLGKLKGIDLPNRVSRPLSLDPTDERSHGIVDPYTGVRWPGPIEELEEVVPRIWQGLDREKRNVFVFTNTMSPRSFPCR